MKLLNSLLAIFVITCLAVSACESPQSASPDSESHFLERCNDGCGAGLACLCGVCTTPCTTTSQCSGLSSTSACGPVLTEAGIACQSSPTAQTCDVTCNADDGCLALGDGYTCQRGLCRHTPAAPSGGSTQSLRVALPSAAAGTKAIAVWDIQVGNGDGNYKFGEANILDGVAQLDLLPLPAEAIQAGTVVGGLLIVPVDTVVPNGIITDMTALQNYPMMKGFLLYRPGTALPDRTSWGVSFPNGYACGVCQPATTGFDSIEPSACSEPKTIVATADFGCNYS